MLLGTRCAACSCPGGPLCRGCAERLTSAGPMHPPPGIDSLVGLIAYEGVGRDLILGLKYHNNRSSLALLADTLADTLVKTLSGPCDVERLDVVTWAPTSRAHRHSRGYDQAELLARSLALCLHLRCRGLLIRQPGPAQTGRSLIQRESGVHFTAKRGVPPSVLVVDDVVTSGATLSAAAMALRAGGAHSVAGAVLAATP